jgi:dienelactone hydrolase
MKGVLRLIFGFFLISIFIVLLSCSNSNSNKVQLLTADSKTASDTIKRKEFLNEILKLLPAERLNLGHVSFLDTSIINWLKRTGELPPDFDKMPSIPFLPNPLILDEGRTNIPIKNKEQWEQKRRWMKEKLAYYISGTCPPKPTNLKAEIISEKKDGQVTLRMVRLLFGPDHKATLTLELMIPPGDGPFPVFLTQWNHREWAQVAVRRGYAGCVYAGSDDKDDTEKYAEIWAGKYDFSRLMRRAFGASRAVDYLYTLPFVDKNKIALTGHSRNGKQSLMAAAFDERIDAVIPSSGGTGAEIPWRYCVHKYDVEDIALLTCARPSWFHPRLRFFVGRENKLPVDQNLFMALVAPRGLMLSTSINERGSNPWGAEQAFLSAQKVYDFLGAKENVAIRLRHGKHSVRAQDMEDYIDFFDFVFGRNNKKPENKLYFNYSFENWCKLSGEKVDAEKYPIKNTDNLLIGANQKIIQTEKVWEAKKPEIQKSIQWILGDPPAGVTNFGPRSFNVKGVGEKSFGNIIPRPVKTAEMGCVEFSPYHGFGDQLFGYLYYPKKKIEALGNGKLPVVIYLHEYDFNQGFSSMAFDHEIQSFFEKMVEQGFAVFTYDMIGFGNRNEEGTRFYERYPHWSKMGKSVADLKGAVDALSHYNLIDSSKIFVAGYSYGATVALFGAALDERIAGVVTVAGFTPLRLATKDSGMEGVKMYSHLNSGQLPRLGFFVGNEAKIPADFNEILACIAPRPLLIIAPKMDKDANNTDIQNCVKQVEKVYRLYNKEGNVELFSPNDYNRFSYPMRNKTYEWAAEQLRK